MLPVFVFALCLALFGSTKFWIRSNIEVYDVSPFFNSFIHVRFPQVCLGQVQNV